MRVLSVAEKPSVAKELSRIMNGGREPRSRRGISPYNHNYDVSDVELGAGQGQRGQRGSMVVTSVSGHMMEINFDDSHKHWNSCSPVALFSAPIIKYVRMDGQNRDNVAKNLRAEAANCTVLLLWLDCDTEGENIAYEVIQVCCEANPRLQVLRARFSALTERDVFRALRNPDRPNPHMNDAVDARQEVDLRLGAAFTRFQTMRYQKKFDELRHRTLSYGPCQFPTLGFIVDRYDEINDFLSDDFWSLHLEYQVPDPTPERPDNSLLVQFKWARDRIYDRLGCLLLFEPCIDQLATVVQCDSRPKTKSRPVPLNTVELQKCASRYLNMDSQRTLDVAEALYQKGILSYPRTETNYFQDSIPVRELVEAHVGHDGWGPYTQRLIGGGEFQWPLNGNQNDQAHPPIHPTQCVSLQSLESDEHRKVYEFVVRHFLASCSQDATGEETTVGVELPKGGERFTAHGLMITARNYLDVYPHDHWSAKRVPLMRVGDSFSPTELRMTEGHTEPPPLLSESDLISAMDRNKIGTDATIATHISTITTRQYCCKNAQNRFEPTELG